MNKNYLLRKLDADDAIALASLAELTYRAAYETSLTAEEVEVRLADKYKPENFRAALTSPDQALWGIYSWDGKLAGYLQLAFKADSIAISTQRLIKLFRIYVHPRCQSQGFGRVLMEKAESICRHHGYDGLWLHCFEDNQSALQYYLKWGYEVAGTEPFEIVPGRVHLDIVLVKRLPVV